MNARPTPAEILRAKGVPHRRMEDWKYTDLKNVLGQDEFEQRGGIITHFAGHEVISVPPSKVPEWAADQLRRFVDASGVRAAAEAFAPRQFLVRVPRGAKAEKPLSLHYSTEGNGHLFVLMEPESELTLLETHVPEGSGLRNVSLSVVLLEGAKLTHISEAKWAGDLVSVETISVIQERGARYTARFLNAGAKLSRTELDITLNGEGAEADLSGVSILGDEAHADITTRITHAAPNTTSRQLFKKVAGGKSRAVYQGKISVKEGAIGSDSRQTAKALLLSDRAEADLKPELEILADDVKCAHGAAVGDLDQDSLFYLRSRGIPEVEARALLIHAFLQEVVDGIGDEETQQSALSFIEDGLVQAMRSSA